MSQLPLWTGMVASGMVGVGHFPGSVSSGGVAVFDTKPSHERDVENLLLFVLEALASHTERGLLAALRDNPNDQATRNAYIDYLQEQGRPTAVKLLQQKWTPGGKS